MVSLPDECLLHVFCYLKSRHLKCCTQVCRLWHRVGRDNTLWKSLSVKRWGVIVCQYDADNWFLYYKKRSSSFLHFSPSPMHLIQEDYHHDPWKLLICCILCSRTSTPQKFDVICEFFSMWPTPSDVITGDPCVMKDFISVLGLQDLRVSSSQECCRGFLLTNWMEPIELKGIGEFGNDSWRLFCGWPEGPHWTLLKISDRTCAGYHKWLVNYHKKQEETQTTDIKNARQQSSGSSSLNETESPVDQLTRVAKTRTQSNSRKIQKKRGSPTLIRRSQRLQKQQNLTPKISTQCKMKGKRNGDVISDRKRTAGTTLRAFLSLST
ncbi:uncharacterized protein LOC134196998 [Corticium candelabrum]|uniref:uncharacterized protein LOC134196998 n=1 Tax=Corticium candelabrum TaxID=121492 RepID=UPI002E2655EA|nr:uncharacterized protein LOC134196998 [Corticium candelabrum]